MNSRLALNPLAQLAVSLPLRPMLQRLPGVWLVFVVLLGLVGPAHFPFAFAAYALLLHVLSLNAAARVAFGAFCALRGATRHSFEDWPARFQAATGFARGDLRADLPFDDVAHVIIIPGYKENMDTWCETLDILASHSLALSQYKICLAMEAAEKDCETKAMALVSRYIDSFLQIVYTIHPRGIDGETAGKHSNVSWAARQMTRKSKSVKTDLITVMDCDTAFAEDYFTAITYHFAVADKDSRILQLFAPGTVFDRNADEVPVFVRLSDMLWSAGVMGNYVPFSPITIPCSAYSLSMELAQAVNFWDVGPEGMGEDMHMFLKCFFATEGRIKVTPIYSPASCLNIVGAPGSGMYGYMMARYGQAKRHMWGGIDDGYALRKALLGIVAPGYDNVIIGRKQRTSDAKNKNTPAAVDEDMQFDLYKLMILFHRLAEAHIVGGHMFILIIMTGLLVPLGPNPSDLSISYWQAITDEAVHPIVILACNICGYIRITSLLTVIACAYYYEQYQRWVGNTRWKLSKMGDSQPLTTEQSQYVNGIHIGVGKRVQHLGRRAELETVRTRWNYLDWFAIPITGLFYQALPQIQTQIMQLWTDRLDYVVAARPTLKNHPASHPVPEEPGIVHVFGGHERMPGEPLSVAIPPLDMDDVETLVSTRVEHGPDEILVLQGLKAHRLDKSNSNMHLSSTTTTSATAASTTTTITSTTTPPQQLQVPLHLNGNGNNNNKYTSHHSHTNSFSSSTDFVSDASTLSFPTSPRMGFVQQPPAPFVSQGSPMLKSYGQHHLAHHQQQQSQHQHQPDRNFSQNTYFDSTASKDDEFTAWDDHEEDSDVVIS
ncbi:hypothetical protein BDR26DRAFT_939331 [Obelidium mucronatum]|nr:hypothetical protein BDR26DRAFT_939331 [Obelidium mucronatum]